MDVKLFAFFLTIFFVTAVGFALGFILKSWLINRKKDNLEEKLSNMRVAAQDDIAGLKQMANAEVEKMTASAHREAERIRKEILQQQDRLHHKEASLEKRQDRLDEHEEKIETLRGVLELQEKELEQAVSEQTQKLEHIAKLSVTEARDEIMASLEQESNETLFVRMSKLEQYGSEQLEKKARDIVATAIQRFGNSVDNDIMSTYVNLPDDDSKGKIIGKEGRNIKAFEKSSGVQLLIDETPGQITISSYDPIRRSVAKTALDILVKDGRIQPARIEEVIEQSKNNIQKIILEKGQQAASECEVYNLPTELLQILGRLYFRYSFGQNVLQHSIEMSHIAKVLASEIGADVYVARAGALLHDIGKAVDHEVDGTHVEIGRRILQKYGVDEAIVVAMQAHHEEYPYETVESRIVQTADAISSARPGARSDNAEMYIQKLEGLERIAQSIEGVEEAYVLSAGREIRVFVNPASVNDFQAAKIAKKVAQQIEMELKYPGEIRVTVIREKRTVEFAR